MITMIFVQWLILCTSCLIASLYISTSNFVMLLLSRQRPQRSTRLLLFLSRSSKASLLSSPLLPSPLHRSLLIRQSCHFETSMVCCCSWWTFWALSLNTERAADIYRWNVWTLDEKVVHLLLQVCLNKLQFSSPKFTFGDRSNLE